MSTILIGVDDSARSEDAVAFARRLAGATAGPVVVACAFPYAGLPSRGSNLAYRDALRQDATRTARRHGEALDLPGDRVEIAVVADPSPAGALHRLAEERKADIVIVGHTRWSRAARIFPGSTAERLLHGSPCPVAVVPEGYRERRPDPVGRIGAAYTDAPESLAALAAAASAARALGARLEVIGVVSNDLYETPGMLADPGATDMRDDAARYVQVRLDKVADGLRADVATEAVRLHGDPAEQLCSRSAELDLLVMGSRGYGPLHAVLAGGVSGRVTREAHCPVIVVPRGAKAPLGELFGTAAAASA